MILAFLLSGFVTLQAQSVCDNTTRATPAPNVGVSSVLWFCGPVSASPSIQLWYQVSVDGVDIPSPGLLMRYWVNTWGAHVPPPDDVSPLGRTSYVSPGPIVTLTSPGPHTIRVVYGPDKRIETFQWVATVPTPPIKGRE